ncbi:MAG: CopG family transcriptional regulator [Armatimonadetes bacterium]|nr:CopG family transcriptional regulator [Armatimonadota bacterium]
MTAQVSLTEAQSEALQLLSERTGKTPEELIGEAVHLYLQQNEMERRRAILHRAKGMWKDRTDLPDLREMREEWNRF